MPIDPKKIVPQLWDLVDKCTDDGGPEEQELRRLLAEREEMLTLLREVEDGWPQCPWCGAIRRGDPAFDERAESAKTMREWLGVVREAHDASPLPIGHAPDCRLAAFLRGASEGPK